jgi:hypothetical protein
VRGYCVADLLDPCRRYCAPETAETLDAFAASHPLIYPLDPLDPLDLLDTAPHNDEFLAGLAGLAGLPEGESPMDLPFEYEAKQAQGYR